MRDTVKRRILRCINRTRQNVFVRGALKGASYKAGATAVGLIILWWQHRH
ncbi:hypothetical protein ACH5AL_38455 [Actinacidiphila glaucinigra]